MKSKATIEPPNAIGKKQADKTHLQSATFVKKEGWPRCSHKFRGKTKSLEGETKSPGGRDKSHGGLFPGLET